MLNSFTANFSRVLTQTRVRPGITIMMLKSYNGEGGIRTLPRLDLSILFRKQQTILR